MRRMTLDQRQLVIKWIAEGLKSDEINKRAALQEPPFSVPRSTITYYRNTRRLKLQQVRDQIEELALTEGFTTAAARIQKLVELATAIEEHLLNGGLWVTHVKGIGRGANYERIEEQEFNAAEVEEYRGILDDIAKELGQRAQRLELEEEIVFVWDLPVPGWSPPALAAEKNWPS